MDGRDAPARIAEVIAAHRPDIVALQELDVRRPRSGGIDQAEAVAGHLAMSGVHFHPALRLVEEEYGDAILTDLPCRLVRSGPLPGPPRAETRGALWVSVEADGGDVQVVNTHLGLWPSERLAQAGALLGPDWLGDPRCAGPALLVGDFNATPRSAAYRRLAAALTDAQLAPGIGARPRPTFPSPFPMLRIDHVFARGVRIAAALADCGPLARIASDHLPLVVDFELAGGAARPTADGSEPPPGRYPGGGRP